MKKLFTLFTLVLMAVSCFATDYTGNFTMDGKTSTKTIAVNKQDNGKYTIILKDFSYTILGMPIPLGDITVSDIDGETTEGKTHLTTTDKPVTVKEKYSAKITLNGDIVKDKFTANIDINVTFPTMSMSASFDGTDPTYDPTGITNLPVDNGSEKVELYNLQGQRISEAKPGQVVIEKRGGKTVKKVVK